MSKPQPSSASIVRNVYYPPPKPLGNLMGSHYPKGGSGKYRGGVRHKKRKTMRRKSKGKGKSRKH